MIKGKITYDSSSVVELTEQNPEVILSTAGKYCSGDFRVKFDCPIYQGGLVTSISVAAKPSTTQYRIDDILDTSGMVVKDNLGNDVTDDCTTIPANGSVLTADDTSLIINYKGLTYILPLDIGIPTLIEIISTPDIINYYAGAALSVAGVAVSATYSNGLTKVVTNECSLNPVEGTILTTSHKKITFTYKTVSVDQTITVTAFDPLCFTSTAAGSTIQLDGGVWTDILYSTDNKVTWINYVRGSGTILTVNANNKVYFRGINWTIGYPNAAGCVFRTQGSFTLSGHINTILSYIENVQDLTGREYCFRSLFRKHDLDETNGIKNASALKLNFTLLYPYCFYELFDDCYELTAAPSLSSNINLAQGCYATMFENCKLTSAPALPADILYPYCYHSMFMGCDKLTKPPALPATTLASYCYRWMFWGCIALVYAPKLPATTLAEGCYQLMFEECTALCVYTTSGSGHTVAWKIPLSGTATGNYTMLRMFDNCKGADSTMWSPNFDGTMKTYYTLNSPV